MAERTLVRINLDPPHEIARLDGLDPELVERIVSCRLSGILFIGPEDLTQVEGIDLRMAFGMAAQIDWEAPPAPPPLPSPTPAPRAQALLQVNWRGAAGHGLAVTALLWLLLARVLPMLGLAVVIGRAGEGWRSGLTLGALALAVFFMMLGSLTSATLALTRRRDRARRGRRARSTFSMLAVSSLLLALLFSLYHI